MRDILVDEEVFAYLQSRARPFEDEPNDVLRREFKLDLGHTDSLSALALAGGNGSDGRNTLHHTTVDDYTNRGVSGFKFRGQLFPARSYKDVLLNLANHLRASHGADFDRAALKLHGSKREYFSRTGENLKYPVQLSGRDLFVETNLSANGIIKISRKLISGLGYKTDDLELL